MWVEGVTDAQGSQLLGAQTHEVRQHQDGPIPVHEPVARLGRQGLVELVAGYIGGISAFPLHEGVIEVHPGP